MNADALALMLILDVPLLEGRDPIDVALAAERGGVTSCQLRWKGGGDRAVVALARTLRERLRIPLLVNDRLDIALAARAAGVHLGANDLPVGLSRKVAPAGFIIGSSVGDEKEAAASAGADYVGIGPWRRTSTKPDAGAALGPAGVTKLLALVRVPAVVIGGVRPEDVGAIAALGGAGVAVAGGILSDEDVAASARRYST